MDARSASDDGPAMEATRVCAVPEGASSAACEGQMDILHALPQGRVAISHLEVSNSHQKHEDKAIEAKTVSTSDPIVLFSQGLHLSQCSAAHTSTQLIKMVLVRLPDSIFNKQP